MSSIKVLKLPVGLECNNPATDYIIKLFFKGADRVEPVFNRPGLYLVGSRCWAELPTGVAYKCPIGLFWNELHNHYINELTDQEKQAIIAISRTKLSTQYQRDLADDIVHYDNTKGLNARLRKFKSNNQTN